MATSLGGDLSAYSAARFAAYSGDNLSGMAKVKLSLDHILAYKETLVSVEQPKLPAAYRHKSGLSQTF